MGAVKFQTPGRRELDEWCAKRGRGAETELAKAIGAPASAVCRWRMGDQRPSAKRRGEIEAFAKIPVDAWLTSAERKKIAALRAA